MKTGVLGGGLTGLALAYFSPQARVFEKEKTAGGMTRTFNDNGFLFDCGPHIFYTKDQFVKGLVAGLIGELPQNKLEEQPRKAYIYINGVYVKYPFEVNLAPLPEEIRNECIEGVRNRPALAPKNFREWILATFGEGVANHYMIPYNQKVWRLPLEQMGFDWIADRVPTPKVEEMVKGSKQEFGGNAVFFYPRLGGIQSIVDGFYNKVKERVQLGAPIEKVKTGKVFKVVCANKTLEFERLVSTLPLPELVNALDDVPTEVENAVRKLVYNSLVAVGLGIKREKISDKHWLYFPEDKFLFNRVSFPMNFAAATAPAGTSSVLAETTFLGQPKKGEDYIEDVVAGLSEADILKADDEIVQKSARFFKYAYVVYDLDHRRNVSIIHDFLRERGIVPIGRYSQWEYINMDHCILSAKKAAENFK